MKEPLAPRKARFQIGDCVRAIGPSMRADRENTGHVTEIMGPPENAIYRYRVTFGDGTIQTFFGFELELVQLQSSS